MHVELLHHVAHAAARAESKPGDFDPWVLAREIATTLRAHRPDLTDALDALGATLNDRAQFDARATDYLAHNLTHLPDRAADELFALILNYALRPTLHARASAFTPNPDASPSAHCPACGGLTDFAALRKEPNEGERVLLCARCDTEWVYLRVGCPFCGDTDTARQSYHTVGDDARYRLYVCGACNAYLKTVDQRAATELLPLPAERVLTLGLDVAAMQAGYRATLK
jgi:formate dehydrogenase accessory protein FdhE